MPSTTSRVLTVRLPNGQADLVEEVAAASGQRVSAVIRDAVVRDMRATLAAGIAQRAQGA
ncbi:MAG TPA: hypothetical protein VG816_13790 [Solirubrobacterales bacterium]|nr:hypothetical protein [Solirubrobacterales bacterium]